MFYCISLKLIKFNRCVTAVVFYSLMLDSIMSQSLQPTILDFSTGCSVIHILHTLCMIIIIIYVTYVTYRGLYTLTTTKNYSTSISPSNEEDYLSKASKNLKLGNQNIVYTI